MKVNVALANVGMKADPSRDNSMNGTKDILNVQKLYYIKNEKAKTALCSSIAW